jgi:hypothetical protein
MEKIMGKLDGLSVFLSGGIDRVKDDGCGWRNELKVQIIKRGISLSFLDPCAKPVDLKQEIGDEKRKVEELKKAGESSWKELQKTVKEFKRIDYRMIDKCDFYILYVDINTHLCGSYFECKVAEEERKPMFFILAPHMKKTDIPTWLVDIANWENIFLSIEDCVSYLEGLNSEKNKMCNRWIKVC